MTDGDRLIVLLMFLFLVLGIAILAIVVTENVSYHEWAAHHPIEWEQDLSNPNWDGLVTVKPLLAADVAKYTKDYQWQTFRTSMLNQALEIKYVRLLDWLQWHNYDFASRVQVSNYVNALKRGGLIK